MPGGSSENNQTTIWLSLVPGFVSFFSDVPGPCDEVLAQIGDNRVGTHHLGAKDVAEDTVIIVEVDGQQLPLWRRAERKRVLKVENGKLRTKCTIEFLSTFLSKSQKAVTFGSRFSVVEK